jgi:hypothetical protein
MRSVTVGTGGFDLDILRISQRRFHKPAPTDPIPKTIYALDRMNQKPSVLSIE